MKEIKTFIYGSHFYAVCIVLHNREVIVKYYAFAGMYVNEIKEFPEDETFIGFVALNELYQQIKAWTNNEGLKIFKSIV